MSKYLIMGNSAAAVGAIEAIRKTDREGPITVVSDEPYVAYSRPLISYLLGGLVDESRMPLRDEDFYARNGVEALLGVEATAVRPATKEVEVEDGSRLGYERLLVACGGVPIRPPFMEDAVEGVFNFTTWDDARAIAAYIEREGVTRAVVLGGGLIGLKATEALIERRIRTTVVELADRVLSLTFDKKASQLVEQALRTAGCELITGNTVFDPRQRNGKISGVVLREGGTVDCELLIVAIGVRPNLEPVREAGLNLDRGIVVDRQMRTSMEDIYAAGDVTQAYDLLSAEQRTIAIWPNAMLQGRVAGANMAGTEAHYDGGLAMNAVEIAGVPTISVGVTDPTGQDYEVMTRADEQNGTYKKVVIKDDTVVGSIFVGDISRAGIITGLIRDRANVALFKDKLLRDDFGLVWLPKDYRKHLVEGPGMEV